MNITSLAIRATSVAKVSSRALAALTIILVGACDSGSAGPVAGTITFNVESGVDFHTGTAQTPGNFANSDLFSSRNGTHLKLATGGDSPTHNRPVTWFVSAGNVHQSFASLAEVPVTAPTSEQTSPLVNAETGHGFVLESSRGALIRGWLAEASASSVTIHYEQIVETE